MGQGEPKKGEVIPVDDSGIQHKHTPVTSSGFGFDDSGERVAVVLPDSESEGDVPQTDSLRILKNLVALLTENATPLQTGQRMHLIAYLVGVSDCKTHAEVARQLNVSPGRVSQISRELPAELARLSDLKSRTAKARGLGRKAN
jgi:hypothetical protein